MMLFLVAIWILPADASLGQRVWLSEVIQEYRFASSDDQRWAHVIAVVAVFVFSVVSLLFGRRGTFREQSFRFLPSLGLTASVALTMLVVVVYRVLVPIPDVAHATTLIVIFAFLVLATHSAPSRLIEHATIAAIGAYLAILIAPGLFVRPIPILFGDPSLLVQLETHLLPLSMRGSAIAAGQNFFGNLQLDYGLLMPSIMSVIEVRFEGLSLAAQLRFVQACQILFCIAAVLAYFSYRPRNSLGILVALLLAGPFWATAGLGTWFPNQTGYRSVGLPLGMLALAVAGRFPVGRAAWLLGAVVGLAMLINFETAVAIAVGYFVYVVVRTNAIPVAIIGRMALAGAFVVVLYMLVYPLALGRFPFEAQSTDPLLLIKRFAGSGYGFRLFSAGHEGEGYYVVPFALLMFTHAMHATINGFRKLGRGILPYRAAMRTAVSATLIVWLAYYFNAPNWWQIWTALFLYGFLITDLVDRRYFMIRSARGDKRCFAGIQQMRIAPGVLVTLLLLAFLVQFTNRQLLRHTSAFMYPAWLGKVSEVSVLSGILLPRKQGDYIEKKAKKLKELHKGTEGRLVYVTNNMAFMPLLTRIFEPGPYRNMFLEIPSNAALVEATSRLLKSRPDIILVDDPDGPFAVTGPRTQFQDRLRTLISQEYRLSRIDDGWQIWQPIGSR